MDLPFLYKHRPAWDLLVLALMLGGTSLCVTSNHHRLVAAPQKVPRASTRLALARVAAVAAKHQFSRRQVRNPCVSSSV